MGRFRQGKIIGLAVAVCLIVICGVLLWRAKPHKTEETLVISHALKEDKGSNTTHKKQAEMNFITMCHPLRLLMQKQLIKRPNCMVLLQQFMTSLSQRV